MRWSSRWWRQRSRRRQTLVVVVVVWSKAGRQVTRPNLALQASVPVSRLLQDSDPSTDSLGGPASAGETGSCPGRRGTYRERRWQVDCCPLSRLPSLVPCYICLNTVSRPRISCLNSIHTHLWGYLRTHLLILHIVTCRPAPKVGSIWCLCSLSL